MQQNKNATGKAKSPDPYLLTTKILDDDKFTVYLTYKDEPVTFPTSGEVSEMANSSDIEVVASPKQKRTRKRLLLFVLR